jgi:hypothetical protein
MILAFLFPILAFAHIIQDDVSVTEKSRHSFKYVCSKSGFPDSPLIEATSGTKLDCMSKKVEAGDFCDKELAADPYYLRGYIDKEKQEVVCVSGKKVLFKYLCVKLSDRELCSALPSKACAHIKGKLAHRLDIVHSSFVTNPKGIKQLNCFFESLPLREK